MSLSTQLYFGLHLEETVYPKSIDLGNYTTSGIYYCGPNGLLTMLEKQLGTVDYPSNNNYLRVEQFRQTLQKHVKLHADVFYKDSFEADSLATAANLLSRRDELILAGWNFQTEDTTPERLKIIANIESLRLQEGDSLAAGFADRFAILLEALENRPPTFNIIYINEPFELLPIHFQRLFNVFKKQNIPIEQLPLEPSAAIPKDSDLARFQTILSTKKKPSKQDLKADGSLLILESIRETDAAAWLSKFFLHNESYRPLCVIPEKNRALDNALIQEGLPSMGILSASLARPTLQILKLVSAFLWQPVDPYKVMEFVSLAVKPLDDGLAMVIAEQMAQTPGLRSEQWIARVLGYFSELETKAKEDETIDVDAIRREYDFWFERRRYDIDKTVPRDEAIKVFDYVARWAIQQYEKLGSMQNSLLVLSEQAKRVRELLMALPDGDSQLSNLRLERIVRTIYEPSPVCFREAEVGHLPYVDHPAALIGDTDEVLWWNFSAIDKDQPFARWYKHETAALAAQNIELDGVAKKNVAMLWKRRCPILRAKKRLVLVMPHTVDGKEVEPHPLYGDLKAAFKNVEAITFNIDDENSFARLKDFNIEKEELAVPNKVKLNMRRPSKAPAYLELEQTERLEKREEESYTSLDSLFYYPYQWVFKHKIKLNKSSILSVVKESTLMGKLSHRVFEEMFTKEDVLQWKKPDVSRWIDERIQRLLEEEGAVLLLYGREPERISFENKMKFSAWSLLSMIQSNGWTSCKTEQELRGKFMNIPVRGIADLVLSKPTGEQAIVDLKWRGANRRSQLIRNEEDLQLIMYSRLLTEDDSWAHTAYFIIEDGKMIARNNQAFTEAISVTPDADYIEINERIWKKMRNTYQWRMKQLKDGKLEIRTEQNRHEFTEEELRISELMDVLEMKDKDAPFDAYRTMIQGI